MREYQLQFTTSRIGEKEKHLSERNRAIPRYPATRREYCHPHLVGAPHKRKSLFFIMSRICFGFFFTTDEYTHLFEHLWKRKRTTGHESFLQLFRKRVVFSQTKSSPSANFARRLLFWTRKNTKKVTSNPRYFLSIALFQTQTPTTRSILDSYHDFVFASRLNFQHIHYSVFPAVVSSSFHLFQIHRLIKTRTKKIHNFYGSALDIGLAQRMVSRTNSIR